MPSRDIEEKSYARFDGCRHENQLGPSVSREVPIKRNCIKASGNGQKITS